jgi:hypothetical protein
VEGSYEHGNENSGSINAGKFLSSYTIDGFSKWAQLHEISLREEHESQVCQDILLRKIFRRKKKKVKCVKIAVF